MVTVSEHRGIISLLGDSGDSIRAQRDHKFTGVSGDSSRAQRDHNFILYQYKDIVSS